jgi:hypothetical protein
MNYNYLTKYTHIPKRKFPSDVQGQLEFDKYTQINEKKTNETDYTAVYKNPNNLSVEVENNIKYTTHIEHLCVDSKDRDTVSYPRVNEYKINLQTPYKNVKSIEMISAIIPNQAQTGSITDEPYLIIIIDELNNIQCTDNSTTGAFTILPLKAPTKSSGGFIIPELGCMFKSPKIYRQPIYLKSLTIRICDKEGVPFNFGETPGSIVKAFQNSFVFKFIIEEKDRTELQNRNVYKQ